jgi:hypothetical protein
MDLHLVYIIGIDAECGQTFIEPFMMERIGAKEPYAKRHFRQKPDILGMGESHQLARKPDECDALMGAWQQGERSRGRVF